MAKALKAPGKNGPSTPLLLVDWLERRLATYSDPTWRADVTLSSIVPVVKVAGGGRARGLVGGLGEHRFWQVQALGHLAEGLALSGEADAARAALAEASSVAAAGGVDGERGTLAHRALAYAYKALGDGAGCDAALAEAAACAAREVQNPTQPWPHLSVAYARTGRFDALIAHLERLHPGERLSFDDERALGIALEAALREGEVGAFERLCAGPGEANGYTVAEAIAAAAARGGEAVVSCAVAFSGDPSYGEGAAVRAAMELVRAGQLPLARVLVDRAIARRGGQSDQLERARATLHVPLSDERLPDGLHALVSSFLIGHAVDPAAAMAVLDARLPRLEAALSTRGWIPCEQLAGAGLALFDVGQRARGQGLVDRVLDTAVGLPSYDRAAALRSVGVAAAEHGMGEQAFFAFKKQSSKPARRDQARALAPLCVRVGDFVGALAVIEQAEERELSTLFRVCDLLAVAAGLEPPYRRHS